MINEITKEYGNQIIYDGESIIGTKENIWKAFKEEIIKELNDNTLDLDTIKINIDDYLEVMKEIQYNEEIETTTLLKISECAMGGYTYKILKESE